ncbi:MAG: tetratricopeptide repeat protein [Candidatus Neomarinimicrobiota bacterium]
MPSPLTNIITELRRRRVFRVAAFYGGIAFVIIQIIDGTFALMGVPPWVSRLLIVLLVTGFPVSMILAWVFDITEGRIVRTKGRPAYAPRKAQPLIGNTALAFIALAAVLVAVWSWFGGRTGSTSEPALGPKSVAVLPFANLSDSKEDEYFSDGMTDDIITHLAKIGDLKVIARTSVMQYKNTQKRAQEIARELGVAAVLEGSVRRVGDKVRIISQLIDAQTDQHLWAETYDRDLTDIFAIQSDVARNIAAALKAILSPEETQRLDERPTESTAAYDYYLRAFEYTQQREDKKTVELASDLYKKAIAVDSSFAQAYARLGRNHARMYWFGYDRTSQRLVMAREAVDQALRLRPDDPVVRVANGYYFYFGFRDYARALEEFYFARRMEPGNGLHAENIAYIQRRLGKFEEAVANLKTALEYDPHSSVLNLELGITYSMLRRYEQAEQSYNRAIELAPDYAWPYLRKAWLHVCRTGNTVSARQVLAEGIRFADPNAFLQTLVHFDIEDNRYNNALERLTAVPEDVEEAQWVYIPKEFYFAWILELMDEPEQAHRHFENARRLLEKSVFERPDDPRIHATLGEVYARLGLVDEAIRESRKAVDLLPVSLDALDGPRYLEQLAEVYTIVGEHDEALEILEHLLEIPSNTSIGSLKFHRVWDPLREHPRFQALLAAD